MIRAADIHARVGNAWPAVLSQLGIGEEYLRKKPGPCPACGGTDRYTFDNRKGRGDYLCRKCGAGDGFQLLVNVHGWQFSEARRRVMQAAGLKGDSEPQAVRTPARVESPPPKASPPSRVVQLLRSTCAVENSADAAFYLDSRRLWPLPEGCVWRGHAGADYFDTEGKRVGRFPALVAEVRDIGDELVTAHVTYLQNGRKLESHEPRKSLSPFTGREGCAARLLPFAGGPLGIAEGIETALSAAVLESVPVWSTLNATLLSKFEPPAGVTELLVFVDRDEAGFVAALTLAERLQGRVPFRIRKPPASAKDWNDVLCGRKETHPFHPAESKKIGTENA